MSCGGMGEIWAIGSDNDIIVTVKDQQGNVVTDAQVDYRLQAQAEPPLPAGDPELIDEGACTYSQAFGVYVGTIQDNITSGLSPSTPYYAYIFTNRGAEDDQKRISRYAEYAET